VMVSSTKTHMVFPAIFMLASAFTAQAAPSLHPSHRQPSCDHGEHFLPASASSAANVNVFSPLFPFLSYLCMLLIDWLLKAGEVPPSDFSEH